MPNRASTFLMIAFLGSGCGRSTTQPEKRNLCEALAIAAGALNDETLKHASQDYAAADRAMQKWEQWEAKAVRPEQNGTGEYSGASQRAQMYARAGSAFCDAARVNAWQLQELAKLTNDRNIIDGLSYLEDKIDCRFTGLAESANERKVFLGNWERNRSELAAAVRDGVDACFRKISGTPPSVHTPGIWVPME